MKTLLALALLPVIVGTTGAFAAGDTDAATMKFTLYKFAVSTSKACTNPITIFESATGVQKDLLEDPTFGSGTVDAGTYPCVMLEVSKIINTSGTTACQTPWDDVICGNGQLSKEINGSNVTCSGDAGNDQMVTLFITTASAGTSGNRSLLPPDDENDTTAGIKLTNAFVVSANTSGTFKVKKTAFITSGTCSTSAPTFSFE